MDAALREKLDQAHRQRLDGDYESSRRLYEELLADGPEPPESAEIRWGYGMVLQFTGLFDECLTELERAHQEDPDNADFHLHLGKTRLMLGDFDGAVRELEEIEQKFPDTPEAEEAKKQLGYFR
jgi:tetratricopeptide (TPR) repeat protein